MRSLVFIFIFHFFTTYSQNVLPLYEKTESGEFLLLRNDSSSREKVVVAGKTYDTISVLSEQGICSGKLRKLRVIEQKECCTKPDPKFLIGTLMLRDKNCSGIVMLGKVDSGKILNYDSLKAKTNLFEWVSEEYQNPVVHKEYIQRYRWVADQLDEKKDVYLQSISKNNGKDHVVTYKVPLKNCVHIKKDSINFFYCETDTTGNSGKTNQNWYDDKIKWSLLYVNKQLIYVTPDFSATHIEGYGPFHNKEQKLSAIYFAKGITYYYFSPGYVIYYKDKEWKLANRKPVKHYGACDCGE